MRLALAEALPSRSSDLPIGAIIVTGSGLTVASSGNAVLETGRVTAHAELQAISSLDQEFMRRESGRMTIAVTLEPCPMCAWAIKLAGIGKLVFGAHNPKYGAAGSVYDLLRDNRHGRAVEVIGGVLQEECQRVLDAAFREIRNNDTR